MREQKRRRSIAMTAPERDAFLATERTCRVATIGPHGPHVAPLWFVWDSTSLWLTSVVRSQRWTNLARDPRIAVTVDTGEAYGELRGVEMQGTATVVGEVPRRGDPVAELVEPERLFAEKYRSGIVEYDGHHAWLRIDPTKITSWDFRKLGGS